MNPNIPGLADPDAAITAIFQEILDQYSKLQAEQNIARPVREFLVRSGLVKPDQVRENVLFEPALAQLVTPTHAFGFKWRIGVMGRPDPRWVLEVDACLLRREFAAPGIRWGILADGRHWVPRRPGQLGTAAAEEEILETKEAKDWPLLYRWLNEQIRSPEAPIPPGVRQAGPRALPITPEIEYPGR